MGTETANVIDSFLAVIISSVISAPVAIERVRHVNMGICIYSAVEPFSACSVQILFVPYGVRTLVGWFDETSHLVLNQQHLTHVYLVIQVTQYSRPKMDRFHCHRPVK